MIIFVVGGAKSNKSSIGELLSAKLSDKGELYYLATMNPYDEDDKRRIEAHIENRKDYKFKTIEQKRNLNEIINKFNENNTVLLDSITSLLTNEMFQETRVYEDVSKKITEDIIELTNKVHNLIIVSDYVFSDGIIYDKYTENFKRELGAINCNIAAISDVVIESVFGSLIFHKGMERIKDEKLI
jgi:adenosylcobinamide kinase/adenosylcobinamide-phosphate guanylyltransferase